MSQLTFTLALGLPPRPERKRGWPDPCSSQRGPRRCIRLGRRSFGLAAPLSRPREFTSLSCVRRSAVGNSTVGSAESTANLAVDVLQYHDVRIDVSFVIRVQASGGQLVQYDWALCDDGG